MIYGPINGNDIWRTRYNNELYTLYDKLDILKVIKMGRLMRLGHLFRMQEMDPCRKPTFLNQKETRRVRKPNMRWLESVEEERGRKELEA